MAIFIDLVAGTPKVGLWCPKCLLPSGYELPIHSLTDDGPRQLAVMRECYDCRLPLPKYPQ